MDLVACFAILMHPDRRTAVKVEVSTLYREVGEVGALVDLDVDSSQLLLLSERLACLVGKVSIFK